MGDKNKTRSVSWRGTHFLTPANGNPTISRLLADVRSYGFTRIGQNRPERRTLIKLGANASGNMLVNVSNAEAEDLSSVVYFRGDPSPGSPAYTTVGSYGSNGVFLNLNLPLGVTSHSGSSSMEKARNQAIRILQRKWTKRRRQFQGLAFAGELGKSISMVIRPAKSLRGRATTLINRLSKLRKRATGSHSSTVKAFADTWLETVFGWKPLLGDIEDGATAIARAACREYLARQQFRAYGSDVTLVSQSVGSVATSGTGFGDTFYYQQNRRVTNSSEVILYGVWSAKLQDASRVASFSGELARLSGLNWADVPSQIWELIPYSFLIDYFSNIGDVIESSVNLEGGPSWVEEVTILETEDLRVHTIDHQQMKTYLAGTYLTSSGPDVTSKSSYRTLSRHGFTGDFTISKIRLDIPSPMQWLNIAALKLGARTVQPFHK